MKTSLLILFFLFIYISNNAQYTLSGISISLGEKQKSKESPFFVQNDEGVPYYLFRAKKVNLRIDRYSEEMKLLSSVSIKLPKAYEKRVALKFKIINNSLFILSRTYDKLINTTTFYTESFSLDTRGSNDDLEESAKVENWKWGFGRNYSPDGSKEVWSDITKENELNIIVFDKDYSVLNTNHIFKLDSYDFSYIGGEKLSYNNISSYRKSVLVDDEGGIYFLRRVHDETDVKTRKVTAIVNRMPKVVLDKEEQFYSYILYRAVKENDYQLESYPLDAKPGYFIKDAFLSIIGHDSVIVSGLYSEKDDLNSAGVFSIIPSFTNEGPLLVENYLKYTPEFCTKYTSDWEKSRILKTIAQNGIWDYYNYGKAGFVKYKDGYITFLEQQISYRISYNATNSAIVDQRDNLIGVYTDKAGEIISIIKVPKRQMGVDKARPSLSIHPLDNNNIQFLFNGVDSRKTTSSNSITAYLMNDEQLLTQYTLPTKKEYPGFIMLSNDWLNSTTVVANVYFLTKKLQYALIKLVVDED
jgi:hypothetical protein